MGRERVDGRSARPRTSAEELRCCELDPRSTPPDRPTSQVPRPLLRTATSSTSRSHVIRAAGTTASPGRARSPYLTACDLPWSPSASSDLSAPRSTRSCRSCLAGRAGASPPRCSPRSPGARRRLRRSPGRQSALRRVAALQSPSPPTTDARTPCPPPRPRPSHRPRRRHRPHRPRRARRLLPCSLPCPPWHPEHPQGPRRPVARVPTSTPTATWGARAREQTRWTYRGRATRIHFRDREAPAL
jgi:hypothetical protein